MNRIADLQNNLTFLDIDKEPLDSLFLTGNSPDAILHFATDYGRSDAPPSQLLKANTLFPLQLLEVAVRHKVAVFLNADTCYSLAYKHLQAYTLSKKQFTQWGKILANSHTRFINLVLQHPYGPGDGSGKFVPYILRQCLENDGDIDLTSGEQRKDFIFVDDVLNAVMCLLDRYYTLPDNFIELDCGTGQAISIREFVTTAHRVSCSKATLRFGKLPYRENEIMLSQANVSVLNSLGWQAQVSLVDGILQTLRQDFEFKGTIES